MKITKLEPKKYKRLFTFGCSFTNYIWPTWADIISQDIPYFENWGVGGSGNFFIFNQFIESLERNNFSEGDLVMILWSHYRREDRYVKDKWIHAAGQEKRKTIYGKSWEENFACDRGNLIRDLSFINSTGRILETLKCDWGMFHMIPFAHPDINNKKLKYLSNHTEEYQQQFWFDLNKQLHNGIVSELIENKDIFDVYKDVFKNLEESVWSVLNHDQSIRPFNDQHPTPLEALKYLETIFPDNTLSDNAKLFAQKWEKRVWAGKITSNNSYKLHKINRL